jgi:hypothetical protein
MSRITPATPSAPATVSAAVHGTMLTMRARSEDEGEAVDRMLVHTARMARPLEASRSCRV